MGLAFSKNSLACLAWGGRSAGQPFPRRQGAALASLLDAFASLLRGDGRDPEAPFLEQYPSAALVRRVLERRARALDAAREAWSALPDEAKEEVEAPTR
jgi:hypothetical protein